LVEQLTEFIEAGDHIILMLDGNSNMKNSDLSLALREIDMTEAILRRHGLQGQGTRKRNSTSTPIDGIWVTPGINVVKAGYFDSYEVVMNTDHRCVWIDVHFESVFGHDIPLAKRKAARGLHCKDPRLIDNYIKLYHQFAMPIQLFQKVKDLDSNAKHMTKSQVIEVYEELDVIRCQATAFAEAKCRKLRTGQVAFSLELSEARSIIKVWSLLVSKAKGRKVSSRFIAQSLEKVNLLAEVRGYDEATLQERLKSAYQEYYKIKSNA